MTNYRQYFDERWLYAHHLQGRDVTVTIAKVEGGELNIAGTSEKKRAPVVHFEGKSKPLVLNKTNGRAIAKLYGENVEQWIGKRITLYPTETSFGRDRVACIRIRPKRPS